MNTLTKMPNMITKKGYQLASSSFILKFVSARQKKMENRVHLEEYTNWRGVMEELINTFEKWPKDVNMVEKEAAIKIREWVLHRSVQGGGEELVLNNVRVQIMDKMYYKQDKVKIVYLHFNDERKTLLMFEIKKKQQLSMLRTLAAEKISGLLTKKEDIKDLEVPRDVIDDLNQAFDDSWRVKYINTDSMKRKVSELSLSDLRKKKDCPYCGRTNFKKIINHVRKNKDCHLKYNTQLEYNFVINNCYW